jgi:hypothetical protein
MNTNSLERLKLKIQSESNSKLDAFRIAINKLVSYRIKESPNAPYPTFCPFHKVYMKLEPIENLVDIDEGIGRFLGGYLSVTINEMLILVQEHFGDDYCEELIEIFNKLDTNPSSFYD